ncbi:MAG: DUF2852 domain-containing protein [Paracoccaceae bacterium]
MYTSTATPRSGGLLSLLRRIEAGLDLIGPGAWIALMVLGFVFTGPFGLILLAYMIWGKKMFGSSCRNRGFGRHAPRDGAQDRNAFWGCGTKGGHRQSGNASFDAYKAETLRRLEDEQEAFEGFLQRLREAKDKSEFDTFMDDRARRSAEDAAPEGTAAADTPRPLGPRPGEY